MKKLLGGAAAVALVALASPALAVPYTYTFNFTSGNASYGPGTAANYTKSTDDNPAAPVGPSETVHVSAYSKTGNGNTGTISRSTLGQYDGNGLGVTNNSVNEPSSSPNHAVDNNNGTDFVVFQFDQKVRLDQAILDLFGSDGSTTGPNRDGDVTIAFFDTNYCTASNCVPFTNGTEFSSIVPTTNTADAGKFTSLFSTTNPLEDPRYVTVADISQLANIYSDTWAIMAALNNTDKADYFKIKSITVTTQETALPEPATWAMMIAGFGFVGASMRRQNRKAAMAA